VDITDTSPRSGFICVLRQDDEVLVKYLQLLPGGVLRISSANNSFAPYDVNLERAANFEVLGRVVASMHDW
jgi:phage repressor protein C with HTH and peptisase S24 domain